MQVKWVPAVILQRFIGQKTGYINIAVVLPKLVTDRPSVVGIPVFITITQKLDILS